MKAAIYLFIQSHTRSIHLIFIHLYMYLNLQKNVGRVLGNEEEVVELLRRGTMINLHVVDFAKMTFLEQIKVIIDLICTST